MQKVKDFLKKHSQFAILCVSFIISVGLSHYFSFGWSNSFLLFFVVLIAFYYLVKFFANNYEKRATKFCLIYSIPFSLSFLFGDKINIETALFDSFHIADIIKYPCLFALIFLLAFRILLFCRDWKEAKNISKYKSPKKPWRFAFLLMTLCWLPYLIAFLPGIISVDTAVQFKQVIDPSQLSNWHPILHTLLIGVFVKIGYLIGNLTLGICLAVIAQYLVVAALLGKLCVWILDNVKEKIFYYLAVFFFALCPVVAIYAITPWKDIVFTSLFALLIAHTYSILIKKRNTKLSFKDLRVFLLLCLLVPFFRNGGLFIIIFALLLVIIFNQKTRKLLTICAVSIVAIISIIQGPIYKAFNIASSPFMESCSVLAQQIAYTANYGNLTDDELEKLENYADIGLLMASYDPTHADAAKTSFYYGKVEDDKVGFIKLWFSILTHNFDKYVKAFVVHTSSYWHVSNQVWVDDYDNVHQGEWFNWEYSDINIFGEWYRKDVTLLMRGLPRSSWFGFLTNIGFLVWTHILAIFIFAYKKKKNALFSILLVMAYLATLLIASPVSWIFRYVYILMIDLPLLAFFILSKKAQ